MGNDKDPKEKPKPSKIPPAPPKPQSLQIIQESADYDAVNRVTQDIIQNIIRKHEGGSGKK